MADATESIILPLLPRHGALLSTLNETDHAAPSLQSQDRLVADLTSQLAATVGLLRKLDRKRVKEQSEHEAYRDSVMRRFAHKATGQGAKFEERAKKEEREYFDVLREEQVEQQKKRNLEAWLAEAKAERQRLQGEVERHEVAQHQLDDIYEEVFAGRTEGYEEEDAKEAEVNAAAEEYDKATRLAEMQGHAHRAMEQAQLSMTAAQRSIEDALAASRMDMFGGGRMADMMERNALSSAEFSSREARSLVLQAQRFDPAIASLPAVDIAHGSIMSDVFFDNIFTDMAFHEKITASKRSTTQCEKQLQEEARREKARLTTLRAEMQRKEESLREKRAQLQKIRETAFLKVAERGQPPAYSAIDSGDKTGL